MKQRKALQRKHLWSSLQATLSDTGIRRIQQAPLYGICPQHPGKLVQRLPDGTEVVGTFQNGRFVPEPNSLVE
jgi:hypothetical protein